MKAMMMIFCMIFSLHGQTQEEKKPIVFKKAYINESNGGTFYTNNPINVYVEAQLPEGANSLVLYFKLKETGLLIPFKREFGKGYRDSFKENITVTFDPKYPSGTYEFVGVGMSDFAGQSIVKVGKDLGDLYAPISIPVTNIHPHLVDNEAPVLLSYSTKDSYVFQYSTIPFVIHAQDMRSNIIEITIVLKHMTKSDRIVFKANPNSQDLDKEIAIQVGKAAAGNYYLDSIELKDEINHINKVKGEPSVVFVTVSDALKMPLFEPARDNTYNARVEQMEENLKLPLLKGQTKVNEQVIPE